MKLRAIRNKRFVGAILPVLGAVGVELLCLDQAQANSGKTILETLGISTAVGTVLGASTLPFYNSPGDHTSNIGIGAALGAATGVGILLYGAIKGDSDDHAQIQREAGRRFASISQGVPAVPSQMIRPCRPSVVMPLVSLTW